MTRSRRSKPTSPARSFDNGPFDIDAPAAPVIAEGGGSRLLTPPAGAAGARGPPARIGQVNRLLGELRRIRLRRTGSRSLQTECALWQDPGWVCRECNIAAAFEPQRR